MKKTEVWAGDTAQGKGLVQLSGLCIWAPEEAKQTSITLIFVIILM